MAKGKKLVRSYTCERCGHTWIPRTADPRTCPNPACNSPYWQTARRVPKGAGAADSEHEADHEQEQEQ